MNAHERLSELTPDSDNDEIVFALLRAMFVDGGCHGSRGAELVAHTLQRVRRELVQSLLWPEADPEELRSANKLPPTGRTVLEMDDAEYERLRDALGQDWEWQGEVRMRIGPVADAPVGDGVSYEEALRRGLIPEHVQQLGKVGDTSDGPSLGGPLTSGEAPAQEPEPEPKIRTRKKRDSAELG